MTFSVITAIAVLVFLLALLVACEIGRRIGWAQTNGDPEWLPKGVGAAEAAVFGLLGLLLAFTFSGAATPFEQRRHLIAEQSNAIGNEPPCVDRPKEALSY